MNLNIKGCNKYKIITKTYSILISFCSGYEVMYNIAFELCFFLALLQLFMQNT